MFKNEDFIRKKIKDDIDSGEVKEVYTRFPPEPNGYLHIGHAKSICLNFGVAEELRRAEIPAKCNLRFDDTNPTKEKIEYIDAIKRDIHWLGWDWDEREYYASDYFEKLYSFALKLIEKGLAYVDDSSPNEIRIMRGTPTEHGVDSPYRNRGVEENLQLFEKMKNGELKEGSCLLRAKIDMSSPNIIMRDPPIYRIRDIAHHRTGDSWRIYPMYDFAHGLSDAIEGITHSLCTLEFEVHRPLYDWFIQALELPKPHPVQIEFSRLNLEYAVMSKRKVKHLVDLGKVDGWDDPRLFTISGLRRRGYTALAIRSFCEDIGITKTNSVQSLARLEETLRTELNQKSTRVMVVIDPVKLIIENYPEDTKETFEAENNQNDPNGGSHMQSFSKHLYVEREDIMEIPSKGFNRITVGQEVRLKYAYYITCTEIIKNEAGKIVEIKANYDPESRGGGTPDGRKVRGTIHWVNVAECKDMEVRLIDVLFTDPAPETKGEEEYEEFLNPQSLKIFQNAKAELFIHEVIATQRETHTRYPMQFLRKGYFILDEKLSQGGTFVCNSSVTLKDGWKKS